MSKKVRTRWRITRIRGSKPELLGIVLAPDQKSAIEEAIETTRSPIRKSGADWLRVPKIEHGWSSESSERGVVLRPPPRRERRQGMVDMDIEDLANYFNHGGTAEGAAELSC
jgi:hypothetical protein